jgi:hypothetical protein
VATVTTPSTPSDVQQFLRVSELMYHPAAPSQAEWDAGFRDTELFEYVELLNLSTTETLNLADVSFSSGITFTFATGQLAPGARIVVSANPAAFEARYGTGVAVAGPYTGNLSNGGEPIKLDDFDGSTIHDFTYDDNGTAWHASTDGAGYSLVMVDATRPLDDWNSGASWRPSYMVGGSPGTRDTLPGDFNGDDRVDLGDFAYLQSRLGTVAGAARLTGDLTGDHAVTRADVAVFAVHFGRSVAAPTTGGSPAPRETEKPALAEPLSSRDRGGLGLAARRQSTGRRQRKGTLVGEIDAAIESWDVVHERGVKLNARATRSR